MAKKKKVTEEQWQAFKKKAKNRAELRGDLTGLFFLKLPKGGAWKLRYTHPVETYDAEVAEKDAAGRVVGKKTVTKPKRITATLYDENGETDITPVKAKAVAERWRGLLAKGIDPQTESQANIERQKQENAEAESRHLAKTGVFFHEIYTPHLLESASGYESARIIKKNFGHLFDRYMDEITAADIEEWEKAGKERIVKPEVSKGGEVVKKAKLEARGTRQRALGAFKGMLAYAAGTKRGDRNKSPVIDASPLAGVTLNKKSDKERQQDKDSEMNLTRDLLSVTERAQIAQGLELFAEMRRAERRRSRKHGKPHLPDLDDVPYPHWFIPFCHIARLTGMRPGDILKLQWSAIERDARTTLRVLRYKPSKTAHLEDPVTVTFPITPALEQVLDGWRQQLGGPKSGHVFPAKNKENASMEKKSYQRHWAIVKELAELDRQDIHFYSFRHAFISDMVRQGVQTLRIANLVGHRSSRMIEKHYFTEDLGDVAAMLSALNTPTPTTRLDK